MWSIKNALPLNVLKTNAILIGNTRQRDKVDVENKITLNNVSIKFQNTSKSLGLIIDSNLSFSPHINDVIRKAYGRLKYLYKYKYVLSTHVKLKLADSLILSLFDYCDSVYGLCHTANDVHKIQVVQNACMRFAANVRRREHITPFFIEYGWNKMHVRRDIHYSCLIHKIIHTNNPPYLRSKIIFGEEIHSRNMRNTHILHIPLHSSTAFKGSFSYCAANIYNGLPRSIKDVQIYTSFKRKIKEHFSTYQ